MWMPFDTAVRALLRCALATLLATCLYCLPTYCPWCPFSCSIKGRGRAHPQSYRDGTAFHADAAVVPSSSTNAVHACNLYYWTRCSWCRFSLQHKKSRARTSAKLSRLNRSGIILVLLLCSRALLLPCTLSTSLAACLYVLHQPADVVFLVSFLYSTKGHILKVLEIRAAQVSCRYDSFELYCHARSQPRHMPPQQYSGGPDLRIVSRKKGSNFR